jgi:transporter family protein
METYVVLALLSMFFAGLTSVIAKQGLTGISSELGLTVRTLFVSVFVLLFASLYVARSEVSQLTQKNLLWLGASGLTTALSWICYYKALKLGNVSTVALIDKGSVVVAVLLAVLILKEPVTPKLLLGSGLIAVGIGVIALG